MLLNGKKDRSVYFEISLLPFLNVMLCTLGIFVLISGTVLGFSMQVSRITVTDVNLVEEDTSDGRDPQYFIWDGEIVTTLPQQIGIELYIPQFDNLGGGGIDRHVRSVDRAVRGSEFQRILNCIARKGTDRYAVFLVRPSGFKNFVVLREYVISTGTAIGYEAVGQHWKINALSTPCR